MLIDLKSLFEPKQNLNCENLSVTTVTSVTTLENKGLKAVTDTKTKSVTSVTTLDTVKEKSVTTVTTPFKKCYKNNMQKQDVKEMVTLVTLVTPQKTQNQFLNFEAVDWLDWFNERAAIYEYENGDIRSTAEMKAFDDCIAKFRNFCQKINLETAVKTLMSYGLHNPFYKY